MERIRLMRDAPAAGRVAACAKQLRMPRRSPWGARVEGIGYAGPTGDPPAHPRSAEVRSSAEPDQPAGHAAALRRDRKPPRCREVERRRVAPQLADHCGQAGASYALLHRPQRCAGIPGLDMDELDAAEPGW